MAIVHAFMLPRERARHKLRQGTPLLHDEPVNLDLEAGAQRLRALAAAARDPRLAAGLNDRRLDIERVLSEAFVRHTDHVAQLAAFADLEAEPATSLALQAMAPALRAHAERLRRLVDDTWTRGYCPICGSLPVAGCCAACGATWHAAEVSPAPFRIELGLPEDAWE